MQHARIRSSARILILSLLACAFLVVTDSIEAQVTGKLTKAKSPYYIFFPTTVDKLTIEPGVTLYIGPMGLITVSSWLSAVGTAKEPIRFVSNGKSLWGGIRETNLASNATKSRYEHCVFQKAATALHIHNSLPVIRDCVFDDCHALTGTTPYGGGIAIFNTLTKGTLTLTNCQIRNCSSMRGGGVYAEHADKNGLVLTGCSLDSNRVNPTNSSKHSNTQGGGLWCRGSVKLTRCVVQNNQCNAHQTANGKFPPTSKGGGLYVEPTTAVTKLERCTIRANESRATDRPTWNTSQAVAMGGGVHVVGPIKIHGCNIVGNIAFSSATAGLGTGRTDASQYGAGIYVGQAAFEIVASIIARNQAIGVSANPATGPGSYHHYFPGLYAAGAQGTCVNSTIARNTANQKPAPCINPGLRGTIVNTIVYHNTTSSIPPVSPSLLTVSYCCIQGGYASGQFINTTDPGFASKYSEIATSAKCIDGGNPSASFNDQGLVTSTKSYGPGAGKARIDIGAHGGPMNTLWLEEPTLAGSIDPKITKVNVKSDFNLSISGGNPRAATLIFVRVGNTPYVPLMWAKFGSERNWKQSFKNFTPTTKAKYTFQALTMNPAQTGVVASPTFTWTVQ